MITFQNWLTRIGLAHCGQPLQDHGIDFDVAFDLTDDDLRSCGLTLGDRRRFLKALAALSPRTTLTAESPTAGENPLERARPFRGERRQLTVMFCDMVGYTEMTQRLDGEALKQLLLEYRNVCMTAVAGYDGYVAQWWGDGLMVYFGWPDAHEDDAERCVRSALDIIHAVTTAASAEPLAVRIGVATGHVVVGGGAGPGHSEDGLAVGETPNLAARLQALANPGTIVMSATTRRLVGSLFRMVDLGLQSLKGIAAPVRAWCVHGLNTEGRFVAAHGGQALSALLGRDEDVALLLRRWRLARAGKGQVLLLSGDPGVGKSRLAHAFGEHIESEPHITLRYQCSSFRENSALYPIVQQFEFAAHFSRDDSPEQKLDKMQAILVGTQTERAISAPLFAALLSLPTDRYPPLRLSSQQQKETMLNALVDQVASLSRHTPVLIALEDAQWIDPTSQELLTLLVARLRTLRVLLLITHRPEYTLPDRDCSHVSTLAVTALPHELGVQLVGEVAAGKPLPRELVEQIVAHADGVPLFIEELTKSVLESGLLQEQPDGYRLLAPFRPLTIPATLSASLLERLGHRVRVRELAQIGACIGREFSHELIAAVSPYKGREFDEELAHLIDTGLVFRRGAAAAATYVFKHALVQDAAYDSLLASQRRALHEEIATVLERDFPAVTEREPEVLAHHYTESEHSLRAVPLWRRAGEAALARLAHQEAVACFENALRIVDRLAASAEREGLELWLREPLYRARAGWHSSAAPDAAFNAAAILRLAANSGNRQSLVVGLWGTWQATITQGRVAASRPLAKRLMAEGEKHRDLQMRLLGHRALLSSHLFAGDLRNACAEATRALSLYDESRVGSVRNVGINDVKTAVGVFLPQCLWMLGYPDQAAQVSEETETHARRQEYRFDLTVALTWGNYVFDYLVEPERSTEKLREAERLISQEEGIAPGGRSSLALLTPFVMIGTGLARLRSDRPAESITLLRRGIEAWTATGVHLNMPYVKAAYAEAVARRGEIESALGLIEECFEQVERSGWHERVWVPELLRLKGWILMLQGNRSEAEAELRASIEWARQQQAKSWELRSATTLAELLVARGDRDGAHAILAPVYDWFTEGFDTHDLKVARTTLQSVR